MNTLFERTSSSWVRYSSYEWKEAEDGKLYLTPTRDAQPGIYDPLRDAQQLVLDALNIGRMCMSKKPDAEIQKAIQNFAVKYGLFGLMTALPTTPKFMDYEAVYLPKNPFTKAESIGTMEYLALFFPFEKPDVVKHGIESMWNIEGDKAMMALAMTMSDRPMAVNMGFQREYAERYDWLKQQFKDWAFTMMTIFFYYEELDHVAEDAKEYYRQSMAAFDGITPTYHIELQDDGPMLVWNLNSLLQGVQLMICSMLTDSRNPVKKCRNCGRAFIAKRYRDKFCSKECSDEYRQKE